MCVVIEIIFVDVVFIFGIVVFCCIGGVVVFRGDGCIVFISVVGIIVVIIVCISVVADVSFLWAELRCQHRHHRRCCR